MEVYLREQNVEDAISENITRILLEKPANAVKRLGELLQRSGMLADLKDELKELLRMKQCGPILIRLSWHDAGKFSTGKLSGGCPNAAMRFAGEGEGAFGANAGLPTVALELLKPITDKYVPVLISHADLWALAANVAIEEMGGPRVATRFGRVDATTSSDSVESQEGRLPDGDKGEEHLQALLATTACHD